MVPISTTLTITRCRNIIPGKGGSAMMSCSRSGVDALSSVLVGPARHFSEEVGRVAGVKTIPKTIRIRNRYGTHLVRGSGLRNDALQGQKHTGLDERDPEVSLQGLLKRGDGLPSCGAHLAQE